MGTIRRCLIKKLIIGILVGCSCIINVFATTESTLASDFGYRSIDGSDEIEITEYNGNGGYVSIPDYISGQMITSIGDRTFLGKHSISIVFIPDTVNNIGLKAFEDNISLTEITLPYGLETVGNMAFSGCLSLTSIVIPNGTRRLGDSCFEDCRKLSSVYLPESITEIGANCFKGCSDVTVYCYSESYSQEYCRSKKVNFEDISRAAYNPYEYNTSVSSSGPYIQSRSVSWYIYLLGGIVLLICFVFIVYTKITTMQGKLMISNVGKTKNNKNRK